MIYLSDDGFVMSGREIIVVIVTIVIFMTASLVLSGRNRNSTNVADKFDDYPRSSKFPDIYEKDDLDIKKREKMIFEEIISGVIFRYDEKTRLLTIGNRHDLTKTDMPPVEVKLESVSELREFVDRLEDYVDE